MKTTIKIEPSIFPNKENIDRMKTRIAELKEELKACQDMYNDFSNSN